MAEPKGKKKKEHPPRVSDLARQSEFWRQTGLRSGPHSAKQRRFMARKGGR